MFSFLKRLFSISSASSNTSRDSTHSTGESWHGYKKVVGESMCQEPLRALLNDLRDAGADWDSLTFTASIVCEPDNPVDPNAIAVHGPDGARLGYLMRGDARRYHRRLTMLDGRLTCPAELRGGRRGKSIGVVLYFRDAEDQLAAIRLSPAPRKTRSKKPASRASLSDTSNV